MNPILNFFRQFQFLMKPYHFALAFLAAVFYGFPSQKMIVIGVTGTKGKTTTCNLIADILTRAGFKVGLSTTVNFRIGDKEWVNDTKQTMLGRFRLQKLLSQMIKSGCQYAVIETSSEGILQYRHRFIDYKVAVFTNLSPEHIERHAGFENYRAAKVELFEQVSRRKDGIGIYNLDDENVGYFLAPKVKNKYGYTAQIANRKSPPANVFKISNIKLFAYGSSFELNGEKFEMPLIGEFNVYNAAAAAVVGISQNVPLEKIKAALQNPRPVPGRQEIIENRGFKVIIDYAHEPKSLEAVYQTAKKLFKPKRMICLLGAQGGGRDKWKRAAMGRIAAQYCDVVVLTNEDPYDEQPENIINDIASGCSQIQNPKSKILKIIDRHEAIKRALSLAQAGEVVILTGKGGEVWMAIEANKKIPWNEKGIVEGILKDKDK